jgi:hypothetical protein
MAVKIARDQPRNDLEGGTVLCVCMMRKVATNGSVDEKADERRG